MQRMDYDYPTAEEYAAAADVIGPIDGTAATILFRRNGPPEAEKIYHALRYGAHRAESTRIRKTLLRTWQEKYDPEHLWEMVAIADYVPKGTSAISIMRTELKPPEDTDYRSFKVKRNYFGDRMVLFNKGTLTFYPGRTMLIGVNGTGKTTLLEEIQDQLEADGIPVLMHDNYSASGGHDLVSMLMHQGNTSAAANAWLSSEGERIMGSASNFFHDLRQFILNSGHECWLLFDAIDSGLSIDNIVELKAVFDDIQKDAEEHGIRLYILCAANVYEMARGERCIEPKTGKVYTFDSYTEYMQFCLDSRARKDKRNGITKEK